MQRSVTLLSLLALLMAAGCKAPAGSPPPNPADPGGPKPEPPGPPEPPGLKDAAAPPFVPDARPSDPLARARSLAERFIIVDGHIDLPDRLFRSKGPDGAITEDISQRTPQGDFDYVRAKAGGLDAPFMSIYISAEYQAKGGIKSRVKSRAKQHADMLIDLVEDIPRRWPDKFALARSPADIERNTREGKISLPMGMENGAAIENSLANVRHFYDRGIRYITLTHGKDNQICDSATDPTRTWKGLSPFGKKVVAEMNRLGILIDVSHISDEAFYQVVQLSKVPVIASHSSARHFVPGFARNMTDDMITQLARNGGVIMINFGSAFISQPARLYRDEWRKAADAFAKERGLASTDPAIDAYEEAWRKEHPRVFADVTDVADHIDHVVRIAGIDHVGLGSDFDGVGDSLPTGLKDASYYPNLIQVLLDRGYSEADIEKICSGNVLRVWRAVEDHAAHAQGTAKPKAK